MMINIYTNFINLFSWLAALSFLFSSVGLTSSINTNQLTNAAVNIQSPDQRISSSSSQEPQIGKPLAAFLDINNGYIYQEDKLFWTVDGGSSWVDITPPDLSGNKIESIQFLDPKNGFILFSALDANEALSYGLTSTTDGGVTWTTTQANLPFPEDQVLNFEKASIDFIDQNTGWLSLKISTSSNFSEGILFQTSDGGNTWVLRTIPLGESVYFLNESSGWVAGGPVGDQLFHTKDGGTVWEKQDLSDLGDFQSVRIQPPHFINASTGWLPVLTQNEDLIRLLVYSTSDGGETWRLSTSTDTNLLSDQTVLSFTGSETGAFTFIDNNEVVSYDGTNFIRINDSGEEIKYAASLFMFTDGRGYTEIDRSNCSNENDVSINCSTTYKLVKTEDGGGSWSPLVLPATNSTELAETQSYQQELLSQGNEISSQANKVIFIGHGFDKCEIPTLAQLQNWHNNSPYRVVNLYIGGSSRYCSNAALSSSFLNQAYQQGWKFIPTWVGPQAPCTSFRTKMSTDASTAYKQGIAEANSASDKLESLGLTYSNGTGSVVYYDLEAFTGSASCYTAVSSFMDGWTAQLHARGNLSGIYGSPCGSRMANYYSLPNPPDVIWLAAWASSGSYNPSASVWDISCTSNSIYANHQRILQYGGDQTETWGGLTFNIDNNVLDGVVAIPNQSNTSCPAVSGEVRVYDQINCGGASATRSGTGMWDLASTFNDRVESVAIPTGWSTLLYADGSESSPSICITSTDPDLSNNTFSDGSIVSNTTTWVRVYNNPACSNEIAPATPVTYTPTGSITTTKPAYVWSRVDHANSYKLAVYDVSTAKYILVQTVSASYCSTTTNKCAYTPSTALSLYKDYKWKVLATNININSPFSTLLKFTPVLRTPVTYTPSGTTLTTKPAYIWSRVDGAATYKLAVFDIAAAKYVIISYVSSSFCSTTTNKCTYTPSTSLVLNKDYNWKVYAANANGVSPYSAVRVFKPVPPPAPITYTPSGNITTINPAYVWSRVDGAASYKLAVYDIAAAKYVIISYVSSSYCSTTTNKCSYTPSTALFLNNDYKWKVLAITAEKLSGPFSVSRSFKPSIPIPAMDSPSGNITTTRPTYIWSRVSVAANYRLYVYDISAAKYVIITTVSSGYCSTSTNKCTYIPTTTLALNKQYKWKILATTATGLSSPHSAFMNFKVNSQ